MALIGTIPGAGSAVFNLDFLPEYFLVEGTGENDQSINNLSVVVSGTQLMSITDADRIAALAKFDSGALLTFPTVPPVTINSRVAQYLKLSTGRINKATTITANNALAGVKNVFAASTNITNVARRAVEQSINPSANATFDSFECLIFSSANVLRAQVTFANGFTDEYTPTELLAMYGKYHVAELDGTVQALTIIDADSGAGLISQVVLFAGAGAAVVVLKSDYVQL